MMLQRPRIRARFVLAILLLAIAPLVLAQEAVAPFVSGLRVAVREPRVRLTWRNVHEEARVNYIYRAQEEITEENFSEAEQVGAVEPGTETFLDVIRESGSYYYAVLSEAPNGEINEVFLPFRNKSTRPVEIQVAAEEAEPAIARVISLQVERRGEEVILRFQPSRDDRDLAIFRATEPIDDLDAVNEATRVDVISSDRNSYTDFPVPGISYYYGVFDTEAVAQGEPGFAEGDNVSAAAVRIPVQVASVERAIPEEPTPRRRPLPFLIIDQTLREGNALVQSPLRLASNPQPLSQETEEALRRLLGEAGSAEPGPPPEPELLPEERLTDPKGPRFTLQTIVEGPFREGRWQESIRLLSNMLSISLPEDVEARVHFYLGQARYFAGEPRQAFLEFVLARKQYRLQAQPWIDRMIRELSSG